MQLLNENCKFQCTGNPSILITASEPGNVTAKDKDRKILTDKAICQVKTPLPCSFLTALAGGIPTNCQLSQTQWMMTDNRLRCNGNRVLTNASTIFCSCGGMIKPIMTSCITKIGAIVSITDISKTEINKNRSSVMSSAVKNEKDAIERKEELPSETQNKKTAQEHVENGESHSVYASHTLCDYENCSERDTCDYFNSQIYVENNSAKLRDNFKQNRQPEWDEYWKRHQEKNKESKDGGWRIAAHHMISGNQVLMMRDGVGELLYGELVKLANYFGYDVNSEVNCIMLPTNENGFGQLEQIRKASNAYDAMWLMGRQWHAGGHAYSLEEQTLQGMSEYYRKHPEQYPMPGNPAFFSNYKNAMKEEMDKLLMKYSKIRCWKINYKEKQRKFIQDMNALSSKVERYLKDFENNPRKSFPFFVSKVAVEYAYDLPATAKLVVIYDSRKGIRAKKIRLQRYMKNGLRIVPVEKDDVLIDGGEQLAFFCENAMHFLIDSTLKDFTLPFLKDPDSWPAIRTVDFEGRKIMEYLQNHGSELMAFVNQNEFTYQPIAKIVGLRTKGHSGDF